MVFVKVRETYDLHTTKNKMTVIGIHTPKPDIIKANYPGLLMQCRSYRPVSADVGIACASMMPLDPQGVGTSEGDVAPEDVFNPILYKAISNKGMSQVEARLNAVAVSGSFLDVDGDSAAVEVNGFTNKADEFPLYYGLLSNTHDWKHANPQSGLTMTNLQPFVYEMNYNIGDMYDSVSATESPDASYPVQDGDKGLLTPRMILGKAKPFPFLPCTAYTYDNTSKTEVGWQYPGFTLSSGGSPANSEVHVPYLNVVCGCIIIPPSRLHELFFRMVVEWTIEFSSIRPLGEVTNWTDLALIGDKSHYQNYSYSATKEAITGTPETILTKDACMVSSNVDINKVM